jgi:hypothetical protein
MKTKMGLVKVVTVFIFSTMVFNNLSAQVFEIPPEALEQVDFEGIDAPTVEELNIEQKRIFLFGISPKLQAPYEELAKVDIDAANELVDNLLTTALELVDEDHRLKEKVAEVKEGNAKIQQILDDQNELIREGERSTSLIITFEGFLLGFRKLTIFALAMLIGLTPIFVQRRQARLTLTRYPDSKIAERLRAERFEELGLILRSEKNTGNFMELVGLAMGNLGYACYYVKSARNACLNSSTLKPVENALSFIYLSLGRLGINAIDPECSAFSTLSEALKSERESLKQQRESIAQERENLESTIQKEIAIRTQDLKVKCDMLQCLSKTLDQLKKELKRREEYAETELSLARDEKTAAQLMLADAELKLRKGNELIAQGQNLLASCAGLNETRS